MEKYFYFRDVANEADDSGYGTSLMVPVKNITAIGPGDTTSLFVWFNSGRNESRNNYADLTVTQGKMKEATAALVSAMNAGPHHDGVTTIFDAATVTDHVDSIEGNDVAKNTVSVSPFITGVAIVNS